MEKRAFRLATAVSTVLQCLMVVLGIVFPVIQRGNLYPVVGTLLAVLAGVLFASWAPGSLLPALVGGALAGGISSLLGVLLATLLIDYASPLSLILVATVSGAVAGAVGGFFGRLFGPGAARA